LYFLCGKNSLELVVFLFLAKLYKEVTVTGFKKGNLISTLTPSKSKQFKNNKQERYTAIRSTHFFTNAVFFKLFAQSQAILFSRLLSLYLSLFVIHNS
jgi:hypothetical protein